MLKRLFERKASSPRRFRHQIYARIAEREPQAWALCGTAEQREKAIAVLGKGGRLHPCITEPWDRAFCAAFSTFKFDHVTGNSNGLPNGFSTNVLVEI